MAGRFAAYDELVLKVGSTGSAVKVLQTALGVTADGDFGPLTKAAVVAYQKQKKLPADGVVRSAVWRALSADAASPGPKPAPSFTLTGSGYGHGVGMSQYGAYAQALEGRTATQIVQTYYPGTARAAISDAALLRVNLLARTPAVTLRVAATDGATGTVYGQVTGAGKAVTFTAKDTVVVRPNSRGGQDVVLGAKVVASTTSGTARLRVTWTGTRALAGRAAAVQVTGQGRYRSHAGQAYRRGEMAISRTGTALNLVNVLRLGDEYLLGVPEAPLLLGAPRLGRPAGPGPGRPDVRLHRVPRRRLRVVRLPRLRRHDEPDLRRLPRRPGPELRGTGRARSARDEELGDHLPGAADQRDVLLRLGRPDDGRA